MTDRQQTLIADTGKHAMIGPARISAFACGGLLALCLLSGCASVQESPALPRTEAVALAPTLLEGQGLALLTPISAPQHDSDRQSLALAFAARFSKMRPEVRTVPLSQTLGAINRAGLTRSYLKMYETFAVTGVMDRDMLAKLRGVCGARYFALLQLAEFERLADTQANGFAFSPRPEPGTRIRLFLQIWDSTDGTIAWEGVNELSQVSRNGADSSFSGMVERIAADLIMRMP